MRRVISKFLSFSLLNMKLRLRHRGKTVPLELDSDTTLNILKLQARDCFNTVLVSCFGVSAIVTAERENFAVAEKLTPM